jgi:transposase InsO family protein
VPWREVSTVSLREEFVHLASAEGASVRALCRRFGVSPTTAYKWLGRFEREGAAGLADRSRRPRTSPTRTPGELEAAVLALRDEHPAWGGRKLAARLAALGQRPVPHPNTVTAILRRHGRLEPAECAKRRAWERFERAAPNELWQADFKGHFALGASGARCHPLTVLDDHSRFCLGLEACADERGETVRERLVAIFRRYGLPDRMLMDNGAPFGAGAAGAWTPLTVWLLRLGIGVGHGRPYHPQTQGKEERFHRTLKAELLQGRVHGDLAAAQRALDAWRDVYNLVRPHEACGLRPPASRYAPSARAFPEALPPIEYGPGETVRKVQAKGEVWLRGRPYRVPDAFRGEPVALRPTERDGVLAAFFLRQEIARIELRRPAED